MSKIPKDYELDKQDKKQIRKAVRMVAHVLSHTVAFTGYIKLNFFEGNLVRVNVEETINTGELDGQ